MCSPVRASSSLANPSLIAESWLPLDRTTVAPSATRRVTVSLEQLDGVGGRHRPVVDVAGDQDRVDGLGAHRLDEVVHELRLGVQQPHLVEGPPQVPVGGVEEAHVSRLGEPGDSRWQARPACGWVVTPRAFP